MKGFVPTPESVVDLMVEKLFAGREPTAASSVLDPGCGRGEFIAGILRWCRHHRQVVPRIVGVESDPIHAMHSAGRFAQVPQVEIRQEDYLRATGLELHDYIVGNPPYIPITGLSVEERQFYRGLFETATGRFDLYQLFFERALSQLRPGGRLVFVTPEKYLYTESASELRRLLSGHHIHELHFLPERTFEPLVTYPLVTTVSARQPDEPTRIIRRDGRQSSVTLPAAASSWQGRLGEWRVTRDGSTLADACLRISCGVATGRMTCSCTRFATCLRTCFRSRTLRSPAVTSVVRHSRRSHRASWFHTTSAVPCCLRPSSARLGTSCGTVLGAHGSWREPASRGNHGMRFTKRRPSRCCGGRSCSARTSRVDPGS